MKRPYLLLMVFIAIVAITQWAVIKYTPNLIHAIAVHRVHKINEWISNSRTNDSMRQVVLPNPDFVYSALFYDVNRNDITISGILPDSAYGSVAFYDNRCQPYYVYNNLSAAHKGPFKFQISKAGITEDKHVKAKTSTGVIICRYLLKGDSSFARMKSYQAQLACAINRD